jgi:redox-sensing transcriptional repressor
MRERPVPEATVARLPLYLRILLEAAAGGDETVSSETRAASAGVNPAKVRKDLSFLGSYGTRGVGYDVAYLIHEVRRVLGSTQDWGIVIAGAGNLGQALANYGGFSERGFEVSALVDNDPAKVGQRIGGLEIRPVAELPVLVRERSIAIGIVAAPASEAQEVVDALVSAGIRSILNFAPAIVAVPDGVTVRKVDLATELQILAYHEQRRAVLQEVRPLSGRS